MLHMLLVWLGACHAVALPAHDIGCGMEIEKQQRPPLMINLFFTLENITPAKGSADDLSTPEGMPPLLFGFTMLCCCLMSFCIQHFLNHACQPRFFLMMLALLHTQLSCNMVHG